MNKRVLFVITGLQVGGAEKTLQKLLLDLDIPASNIKVVSLTCLGEIGEELIALGFDVVSLKLSGPISLLSVAVSLYRIIHNFKPDVVHTWLYHSDFIGGVIARIAGCKNVIWCVRSTNLRRGSYLTSAIRRLNGILSYYIPKKIIYVADSSRRLHEGFGYNKGISEVIPNGYDFDRLSHSKAERSLIRDELNLKESDVLIGCVGRFNQVKGQDILVKALGRQVLDNPHLKLMLVGRDMDRNNKELVSLLAKAAISDHCILVGERSDIARWMSAMDVYCLPSRGEGFPNSLVEAMAVGLPCVATNVGDVDVLLRGYGVIVSSDSVDAIGCGIREIVEMSKVKRDKLVLEASQHVRANYSIASMVDSYSRIYNFLD